MDVGSMVDIDSVVTEYRASRGTFESLTFRVTTLIKDLLAREKIDVIQVESRTKDVESFRDRLSRKGDRYTDPLREITDLSAVRIITYYQKDVDTIGTLIEKEFEIDTDNSINKGAELDPDRFGYMSVHYVASISDSRGQLPEWLTFQSMKVEIQVRTALQHAWAAVNHKLDYKSADEAPAELRRKLFRLSALFELADEQLSDIREARSQITQEYVSEVQEGNFDMPLNRTSLRAYLITHPYMKEILSFTKSDLGRNVVGLSDPHPSRSRDLTDLLATLRHCDIDSISAFDTLMRRLMNRAADIKSIFAGSSDLTPEDSPTLENFLTYWILLDADIDKKFFVSVYGDDAWDDFAQDVRTYRQP
ncbi:hypothetical protein AB0B94_20190 [Micromonospora sp. NPDC048986]|uniref:GTP pyrophosphokinase n=1 Tax=Micromonospora sp. NPDC048986 TaxID=3155644 RepID=UPI00340901BD